MHARFSLQLVVKLATGGSSRTVTAWLSVSVCAGSAESSTVSVTVYVPLLGNVWFLLLAVPDPTGSPSTAQA